jgi:hypothetical protein
VTTLVSNLVTGDLLKIPLDGKKMPGIQELKDWEKEVQHARGNKANLLDGMSSEERKAYPLGEGCLNYFRDALLRISKLSYDATQQHHPGTKVHWARNKSSDHLNCILRHLAHADDEEHLTSAAWRSLALLQEYLETKHNILPPPNVWDD